MARECIFCGERAGSGEHVFPDWLNGVYGQLEWEQLDAEVPSSWSRGVQDFRSGEAQHQEWNSGQVATIRNKRICHRCNTGWMANLEGVSVPLLKPMILGHPRTLTQQEQLIAATWATKTVMVCEASMASDEGLFSQEDRRLLMEQQRPPGHLRVFAAMVEGAITPAHFGVMHMQVLHDEKPIGLMHLYTLQLHTLVLQVMRQEPPAPIERIMDPPAWDMSDSEVRLYPPTLGRFFWPPKESFTSETLDEYRTRVANPPFLQSHPGMPPPAG
jgi:hypothetical protein